MKKPYQTPQMDVIPLSAGDIILTSILTGFFDAAEKYEPPAVEGWGELN